MRSLCFETPEFTILFYWSEFSHSGFFMKTNSHGDVTRLLLDWSAGDQGALNKLMPLVYDELRRIAGRNFQRFGSDGQLQPTALVHEAYIR